MSNSIVQEKYKMLQEEFSRIRGMEFNFPLREIDNQLNSDRIVSCKIECITVAENDVELFYFDESKQKEIFLNITIDKLIQLINR